MPEAPFTIALVGAESTGKSTLARALGASIGRTLGGMSGGESGRSAGVRGVAVVDEYLREFCDTVGRTPIRAEQAGIAEEQTRRIRDAGRESAVVVADTTALMIAVYSEVVFGDRSLYDYALAAHRDCDLTLLTALDLPWQADVLRDGPHVRAPVDDLVRGALQRAGLAYSLVVGQGEERLGNALRSAHHALGWPQPAEAAVPPPTRWQGWCERCSDPDCERRCFAALLGRPR